MDYLKINKAAWNNRTKVHIDSDFYDNQAFKAGKSSLNPIELQQVGDVVEKKLLHLQCHFGQDTLSWARKGALVTGVDLSTEAIAQANQLKAELGLAATFIADDIYHFGEHNTEQFDIVYSSYGVLCWLPDLKAWATTIANALTAGGEFHLIEFHYFHDLLSGYSYFPKTEPDIEEEGTYTENCDGKKSTMITWPHSLSEVINSLLCAGLTIESFNEFAFSPYDCFDGLEYVEEHGFQFMHKHQQVPLVFAIKARKV